MREANELTTEQAWKAAIETTAHVMRMPTGNAESYLRQHGVNDDEVRQLATAAPADRMTVLKQVTTAAYERKRLANQR